MDYSIITSRRILFGFSCVGFVAVLPLLVVLLDSHALPLGMPHDSQGGYRGLVLGLASVIITMLLVAVATVTVLAARRMVGRISRA